MKHTIVELIEKCESMSNRDILLYLMKMRDELQQIIHNQNMLLKKVPKKLRAKKHSVDIEQVLGDAS